MPDTVTGQPGLFDMPHTPLPAPEPPASATVRRTRRQAKLLASGRHPLSSPMGISLYLHPDAAPAEDREAPGLRCGTCAFREVIGHHSRSYPKCLFGGHPYPRASHSDATDVRAWWPACKDHSAPAPETRPGP